MGRTSATGMDIAVLAGMILTNVASALVAGLFAAVARALPGTALRGWGMVGIVLLATTMLNVRVRGQVGADDQGEGGLNGFRSWHLVSQFFIALAWAAMIASLVAVLHH